MLLERLLTALLRQRLRKIEKKMTNGTDKIYPLAYYLSRFRSLLTAPARRCDLQARVNIIESNDGFGYFISRL
jgi:hypothetical protein